MTTNLPAVPSMISDDVLSEVKSFDDVLALFNLSGIVAESMKDYGAGFDMVEKSTLVGVDFMAVQWRFIDGDFGDSGDKFVYVQAMTKHGEKVSFTDGSTGIKDQLQNVTSQRMTRGHAFPTAGLLVMGGLVRSDYTVKIPNKNGELVPTPATTFYLSE